MWFCGGVVPYGATFSLPKNHHPAQGTTPLVKQDSLNSGGAGAAPLLPYKGSCFSHRCHCMEMLIPSIINTVCNTIHKISVSFESHRVTAVIVEPDIFLICQAVILRCIQVGEQVCRCDPFMVWIKRPAQFISGADSSQQSASGHSSHALCSSLIMIPHLPFCLHWHSGRGVPSWRHALQWKPCRNY